MGMTVNAMAGMQAASENVSDYSVTAKAAETSEKKASAETEKDAVYEKSAQESAKAPYSINKMSKEDRAALVKQLKADQESRQNSLTNLVSQMLGKQAVCNPETGTGQEDLCKRKFHCGCSNKSTGTGRYLRRWILGREADLAEIV